MQNHSATNEHNVIEHIKRQTCENTLEDNALEWVANYVSARRFKDKWVHVIYVNVP